MQPNTGAILERAKALYARGFCDQAVGMLSEDLERNPAQLEILETLVEWLVDSDQHQTALQILEKNDLHIDDVSLQLLQAFCHLSSEEHAAAAKIADRLKGSDLHDAYASVIKGRIAYRCGDHARAEQHFGAAIACDPPCGYAHLGLGYLERERGRLADALSCFKKALQALPMSREIAIVLHETAVVLEAYQGAEDAFRHALIWQPLNRRLRFLLIDVMLRQEKFEDAMSEIESCMADFGIDDGILAAGTTIRKKLRAPRAMEGNRQRRTLSLCMIVKDEERCLARCLHSAKPVVDEIIIVDTGSSDRTKAIAEVFGAQVFNFEWVNDFSRARNLSLSKASGDWILVLDADEAISPKSYGQLIEILQAAHIGPAAYSLQTRNYTQHANAFGWKANKGDFPEEEGSGWFPSVKVRLFTNDARIRFVNPVHELVEPTLQALKIAVQNCSAPVHHFGKLDEERTYRKTKAYIQLGRNKLKQNRGSPQAIKELAIQSAHLGEHEQALNLWTLYVKRQPQSAEAYLNIGTAHWNLARYAEAVSFAEKALQLDRMLKEAFFNKGIALLMLGRAEEAKAILHEVLEMESDYPAAQFMLGIACACMGEQQGVADAIAKMQATAMGPYLSETFLEVARRLLAASQMQYARRTIEVAANFSCSNDEILALRTHCHAVA
jgi:tetratricopeptide (TPR) repeat protein